jgi:hypothetical protein
MPGFPGSNDPEEDKPADDEQYSKEQIDEFFRHCPCVPVRR